MTRQASWALWARAGRPACPAPPAVGRSAARRRRYAAVPQLKVDVDDGHAGRAQVAEPAPRNRVGVQLLSRPLHAQVFPPPPSHDYQHAQQVPPLHPEALTVSLAHLRTHGLDPAQAAVLKPTAFTLPPLQGANLAEHFWHIGAETAQPWLSMAEEFASLSQEGNYFSESARTSLLAPPSTGQSEHGGNAGPSTSDEDEMGYLPPQDWLTLDSAARSLLRPRPPQWKWQSGWTWYPFLSSPAADGEGRALGEGIAVPHPPLDDAALVFDVETLVNAGPWPVMATALGTKGWYAWLSPWLTGGSDTNEHLIPFGSHSGKGKQKEVPRLIVGHNVGYDRARILDEYSIERGDIRYLDTMSLHVAIRGISSPQRPAYMKKRKERQAAAEALAKEERDMKVMAKEDIKRLLSETLGIDTSSDSVEGEEETTLMHLLDEDNTDRAAAEVHALFEVGGGSSSTSTKKNKARAEAAATVTSMIRELKAKRAEVAAAAEAEAEDANRSSSAGPSSAALDGGVGDGTVEWHEVTSRNSLLEVAMLHCNIELDKETRDTFVHPDTTVENLRQDWVNLLNYCAADTAATHSVLGAVLPAFRRQCPHPVTFAGVLGMGSMVLPVQAQQWATYKETSEAIWKRMSDEVETALKQRAEEVMRTGVRQRDQIASNASTEYVETDPWLMQLDWAPKKPKVRKLSSDGHSTSSLTDMEPSKMDTATHIAVPKWYRDAASHTKTKGGLTLRSALAPSLIQLRYRKTHAVRKADEWIAVRLGKNGQVLKQIDLGSVSPLAKSFAHKDHVSSPSEYGQAAWDALQDDRPDDARDALERSAWELVEAARQDPLAAIREGPLSHLELAWDWVLVERTRLPYAPSFEPQEQHSTSNTKAIGEPSWWPKWYWDIIKIPRVLPNDEVSTSPTDDSARGHHPYMDLSIRSKCAPLLLQLSWKGFPLFHSREHGWTYRQSSADKEDAPEGSSKSRKKPLNFKLDADQSLARAMTEEGAIFHKLPHASGEEANVGSPFSKSFMPYFENKTLQAGVTAQAGQNGQDKVPGSDAAQKAMALNTECAYWVSARDRIMNQVVVRQGQAGAVISKDRLPKDVSSNLALILPQVITMGTITRRAIERTWLTASNAKKNRVGSELKSMVKAPPAWSIVGADVDSEELWICSVMGDAQFGMHGATAVGWMTLEGTKAQGTDLHSKTASILGTSRNQAKVFNYSRIYGAGIKHATQLMLKANPKMSKEEAEERAKALYRATKGLSTNRAEYFGRKFWHGGTESYVFNKLEAIALSDNPQTPALDCGITAALSRAYLPQATTRDKATFGQDYMPSRINWVVQSSGVDYLHLLISSMEHLCKKYDIAARFMLSVHDEVRYLCRDEDRYRTALALQISNLWTRSMFAYKLEMDDLPQSCAFFAQVDIDHVLRKEVDDPCVTPSNPTPIPNGEALDIDGILARTHNGSLYADGRPMPWIEPRPIDELSAVYPPYRPTYQRHRSVGPQGQYFLEAQATSDINEIRALDKRAKLEERLAREDDKAQSIPLEREASVATPRKPRKTVARSVSPSSGAKSTVADKPAAAKTADEEAWLDQCAATASSDTSRLRQRRRASSSKKATGMPLRGSAVRPGLGPSSAENASKPGAVQVAELSTSSSVPSTMSHASDRAVLDELAELCAIVPSREPVRGPSKAFFKEKAHRSKVLWGLYRPLVRLLREHKYAHHLDQVRRQFRSSKKLVTLNQTTLRMRRAEQVLNLLRLAAGGDETALKVIQRREARYAKMAKIREYERQEQAFINEWVDPPPKPRISGAVMRPTKDNVPMPRYRGAQPLSLTMMIKRRRRQRDKMHEELKDVVHLRDSLAVERRAAAQQGASSSSFSSSSGGAILSDPGWEEGLVAEVKRIGDVERRSWERANMMMPAWLLENATRARWAAVRRHARYQREREREREKERQGRRV